MGAILGVPIAKIIVFWGLYRGHPYSGKLPFQVLSGRTIQGMSDHDLGNYLGV